MGGHRREETDGFYPLPHDIIAHNRSYCNHFPTDTPGQDVDDSCDLFYTIETTGAGDTFCACVINYVLEHGLEDLTEADLLEMLTFANAASSLITTRKGALRVMPEKADVQSLIESRSTNH